MKFAVALCLIGSAAYAECPTAADLAQGIRVRYADDRELTFRTTDDPALLSMRFVRISDGASHSTDVARGLFDLASYDSSIGEPDSGTLYRINGHNLEPAEFPQPSANTRLTLPEAGDWGGYAVAYFREVYHMGPLGTVELGGCSFRAFEVTLDRTDIFVPGYPLGQGPLGEPKRIEGWTYLADLGFAVESWAKEPQWYPEQWWPAPDVVAIEAVR